jgi:predicted Fe-Mo cluster-binding NifX family protein
MKLVVTAQGSELDSPVDPRFGRAKYFLVFDTDTQQAVPLDNAANLNAAHGAGVQSAKTVADTGAEAVISGNIGPKAFDALRAAGIAVYSGAEGSARDAVRQFTKGKLTEIRS